MTIAVPADGELAAFVYHEARLIDEKRFAEWYDLFAEDGLYWMPLTRGSSLATFGASSSGV